MTLPLTQLDLRAPEETNTVRILVHEDGKERHWIHATDINLTERGLKDSWLLEVKTTKTTDSDHVYAIKLRMGLVGVSLFMVNKGCTWLNGFINADDLDAFRVPAPNWNQLEGATPCTNLGCRAKDAQHLIVADGRYIPPPNRELLDKLRGRRVKIIMGLEP